MRFSPLGQNNHRALNSILLQYDDRIQDRSNLTAQFILMILREILNSSPKCYNRRAIFVLCQNLQNSRNATQYSRFLSYGKLCRNESLLKYICLSSEYIKSLVIFPLLKTNWAAFSSRKNGQLDASNSLKPSSIGGVAGGRIHI